MEFKIDTKEKFSVIELLETSLNAKLAVDLKNVCLSCLEKEVRNVVLNLNEVEVIDLDVALAIVDLQQSFYDKNASFVICNIKPAVLKVFEEEEIDEMLNQTPTESEAWDIVQMEEIERELLDGDDFDF